jgi:hypothetical protein
MGEECNMRRKHLLIFVLVAAMATPVMLAAQFSEDTTYTSTTTTTTSRDRQGLGLGFGPILGWYRASDADGGQLTGGLAMRLKLGPALGVEGSITYRQEKYNQGAVTARSWPLMVTGLIYPLPVIYGAIGAGWYNTTFDYDQNILPLNAGNSETVQKFGWHFGGGLELPLGSASFVADIRYVFLNYDFKQLPGTGSTNNDFYVISAGILFGL